MDRVSPTRRPNEHPIGYQTWSNLTFIHWRVPSDIIRPLVPSELELDEHDGAAWLGLVPFYMSGVRPWWAPPIPGVSYFCETNLRTYVHFKGTNPGVWFFSLDAANRLAVWIARTRWCLNYFLAQMILDRRLDGIHYRSQRLDGTALVDVDVRFNQGFESESSSNEAATFTAAEGSFEHFLAERYLLYSNDRAGRLYRGQVHHRPYPLQSVELLHCRQTITQASGINVADSPDHVLFSPGVTVDIFPLRPIIS